nr:hypothetical protein GCM10020241_29410 [Streptoalloteichus tenebrarius]
MIKYVALYRKPADAAGFDERYFGEHMPLVTRTPGLVRCEVAKVARVFVPGFLGDTEPYLMAELYFESKDAMKARVRHRRVEGLRGQPHRDRRHGAGGDVLRRGRGGPGVTCGQRPPRLREGGR